MKADQQKAYWRSVFNEVIPSYQEVKSSIGTIGALDYAQAANSSKSGRCTKIVKPSLSDFVCDIEIAARAVLNPDETKFFFDHYVVDAARPAIYTDAEAQKAQSKAYGSTAVTEAPNNDINLTVQEKVGKMILARNIYPLGAYFKARDVR